MAAALSGSWAGAVVRAEPAPPGAAPAKAASEPARKPDQATGSTSAQVPPAKAASELARKPDQATASASAQVPPAKAASEPARKPDQVTASASAQNPPAKPATDATRKPDPANASAQNPPAKDASAAARKPASETSRATAPAAETSRSAATAAPARGAAPVSEPSRSAASDALASNAQPAAPRGVSSEAKACFQKAQAAYAVGDLASALKGFLCAFQAAPSPELHYNLARVYERMGEVDESARHYRAYLAQTPVTPKEKKGIEARLQSLQELRVRQRPPLTPAQPSADAMSSEARTFYDRGVKLYRVKQYAAAQAAFNAALQMSNAPELHFNLAVVAERMNHAQEAIDHYRAYLAARGDAKDRDKIEERIGILQSMPR